MKATLERTSGALSARATPTTQVAGCPDDLPSGLSYVDDSHPGYTREWTDGAFAYFDTRGKRLTDEAEIKRITALAIPPAYIDVWLWPYPHLLRPR